MKLNKSVFLLSLAIFTPNALANVVGSELQNFNAAAGVLDGVTVSSGRTLGEGKFSLGLFANTAINSLPYFQSEEGNRDRNKKVNDTVSALDFQIAYGVTDRWDLSLSVPSIVAQSVRDKSDYHGEFDKLGNTEVRFGTKYQFVQTDLFQLAVQASANYNRVEGNPYVGNVKFPGMSLEIASSTQLGIVDWSVNIGHRWRKSQAEPEIRAQLPIDPSGDQWLASTGVIVDLPSTDVDLTAEVYAAYAEHVISNLSSRKNSIVETVFGFRKPLFKDFQFHAGVGSEVNHSASSADFRVYLGLRWMIDTKRAAKEQAVTIVEKPLVQLASTGSSSVLSRPADVVLELQDVFFKLDSTQFRDPKYQRVIDQLGDALKARPIERVVIEGYACALGSDDYNFDLSDHRAEAIERMLIEHYRVSPEKLVTVGWGESRPKYDNSKEATRMNNRRVTFRIFYKAETPAGSQNVAH
jgi:outer membrane protein OmpA-like peptidoglycan-associated protein